MNWNNSLPRARDAARCMVQRITQKTLVTLAQTSVRLKDEICVQSSGYKIEMKRSAIYAAVDADVMAAVM